MSLRSLSQDYQCSPKTPKKARTNRTITMTTIAPSVLIPISFLLIPLSDKDILNDSRGRTLSTWHLRDEDRLHRSAAEDNYSRFYSFLPYLRLNASFFSLLRSIGSDESRTLRSEWISILHVPILIAWYLTVIAAGRCCVGQHLIM